MKFNGNLCKSCWYFKPPVVLAPKVQRLPGNYLPNNNEYGQDYTKELELNI